MTMQADEMKAIRTSLHMTQEMFAKAIGTSRKLVNEMEAGTADITPRTERSVQLAVRNAYHPWGNWRLDLNSRKLVYIDPATGERAPDFDVDYRTGRDDGVRIADKLVESGLPETQGYRLRLAIIEAEEFAAFSDYRI